jgi:hypothetical protein
MKNQWLNSIALSIAVAFSAPAAQAAAVSLESISWTASGAAGLIAGDSTVANSPTGNSPFGYVSTFNGILNTSPLDLKSEGKGTENQTNGTKIVSGAFNASANDTLTLYFNYVSTDGRGYDDYAWARLVNANTNSTAAWLFTARSTNSANGNVVPGNVLNRQTDNKLPDKLDAVLNDGKPSALTSPALNGAPWATPAAFAGIAPTPADHLAGSSRLTTLPVPAPITLNSA